MQFDITEKRKNGRSAQNDNSTKKAARTKATVVAAARAREVTRRKPARGTTRSY